MRINFFKLYIGILAAASLLVLLALFDLLPSLPQPPLNLPKGGQIDTAAGAGLALAAVENQRELQHDNYAIYYTPEEFAELFRSVRGSYSGIGVYIYPDDKTGNTMVYGVMRNGPAYQAGILPGDVFLQVDDTDLRELDSSEVVDILVSFPRGTKINLLMNRPEVGEINIEVTTDEVDIPTVDYKMLDETVGLIKIASFNMTTGDQFADAFAELQDKGMQALVLDLRNNGGGELTAALKVCDYFVPKGEPMMYITDSRGVYYSSATEPRVEIPPVILQNEHSASASEILIGAVHDNGTGTTIGETSYGKGIVQDLKTLNSGAGLRFTSAKYSTSHKNDIHGIGIEPDIYFPMPEDADPLLAYTMDLEQDPQLAKAYEVVQSKMSSNN